MADPMEGPARTRLVALVVLLAVALPLTVVALIGSGGGDEEPEPGDLRVERSPELPELIVMLKPDANTPGRAEGRSTVAVHCYDANGQVIARSDEAWPFTDTDQNTRDPHVHIPVNPVRINDVERCRIRPASPPLEGPVI
jgi:hypothetical protein